MDEITKTAETMKAPWTDTQLANFADELYNFHTELIKRYLKDDPRMMQMLFYVNAQLTKVNELVKTETRKKILTNQGPQ